MKKILLLLVFVACGFLGLRATAPESRGVQLPTYYSYEKASLKECFSTHLITKESLLDWDAAINAYFKKHNLSMVGHPNFFAYLFGAQKDAAFLSFNTHGCFLGSLDPLCLAITQLFYPDFHKEVKSDPYSDQLCALVFSKYKERFEAGGGPWLLEDLEAFMPKEPPEDLYDQMDELHAISNSLTEEQKRIAFLWKKKYTWREIASQYMKTHRVRLGKFMVVRARMEMALADAMKVAFAAKQEFDEPRPFVLDPTMKPLFKPRDPNSYPSGHAVAGGCASTILSFYFPHEARFFTCLGKQEGLSRLYAGVHFPSDVKTGYCLGKAIAVAIIERFCRPTRERSTHSLSR